MYVAKYWERLPMAHTVGIIFSAVMVFTIGLVAFCFGVLEMSMAISNTPGTGDFGAYPIAAAIVLIGLGGWGIASGLGIAKMREWARISMFALGAIFVVIAVFGSLEMARDPQVGVSYTEGVYMGSIRPEMMAFYAVLAALGVFWLLFFSRNSVKVRFAS
jgi:hypothetical protein